MNSSAARQAPPLLPAAGDDQRQFGQRLVEVLAPSVGMLSVASTV
jgi:hypothetical protein